MTDDNGDSESDSDSPTTSVDRKARVADTPEDDPRGSSSDGDSSGDE